MKLIATCGLGQCPRILKDEAGKRFMIIGDRALLSETIGLDLKDEEGAVFIPEDVMVEASRLIMLQLAQE